MSEFRQDIVNKNWVLISEGRGRRPTDFKELRATPEGLPEVSENCPFCPGNEDQIEKEIAASPPGKKWQVRVVSNKFEAVGHVLGKRDDEFFSSRPGVGDHEVVISRYHNQPTALQNVELIDLTLRVYTERISELILHDEIRYVHIIQNHGVQAGASLMHPHSQIFAIPFLPDRIHDELRGTRDYFLSHGACVYCEMIMFEIRIG